MEMKKGVYSRNGTDYEFYYKTNLKASEKVQFVEAVVGVAAESGYYDFIRNIMFDFEIIKMLTNIDISECKETIDSIEKFVKEINAAEIVKKDITKIVKELNKAIDDNIQIRTGIKLNSVDEALVYLFETIEDKVTHFNVNAIMRDFLKSDEYKKHVLELAKKKEGK